MDRCVHGWMPGCLNEWMVRGSCMEGCMDGWMVLWPGVPLNTHSFVVGQRLWATTEAMMDISKHTDSVPPQAFYLLFCLKSSFFF